jgi:NAD(P)-dependent dehydrogenase (short-subunit alcohol dehydrogenase family)
VLTLVASGLGLAVATSLASKGWQLVIADMNVSAGEAAATSLKAAFYKTNVTDYASLSNTFEQAFRKFRRIDFVFANAGIVEKDSFFAKFPNTGPPPEINMLSVDIDLKAVIATGYLAQHYFRQNPDGSGGCLVSTSSVGGIYPSPFTPMYAAAKHGVIGFTRSIAKHFYVRDKIRANAILPGTMKTPLLTEKEWERFGDVEFTPISKVVEVVELLVDDETLWGKTVEISGTRHYFREQAEYCDEDMKRVMEATDVV